MLRDIASLASDSSIDLRISIFVTCLCDPEAVPSIANCLVTMEKPSIQRLMRPLLDPDYDLEADPKRQTGAGGGLAIAVSGPESLTREARNAVAGMSLADRRQAGEVAIHTEAFAI